MNAQSAAWTPRIIGIHSAAEFRGTSLRTSVCCYLNCYLVVKELNRITSAKKIPKPLVSFLTQRFNTL